MKCLVTGGAGFIGSNIVHALVERGHQVRVLDDMSTGTRENLEGLESVVDLHEVDLRDQGAVARCCQGIEVVFHEAAVPSVPRSVEDPRRSFEVNAAGSLNLMLAARDAAVRRVVYAASSSVYGDTPTLPKHERMVPDPRSPYAADKLHGENLCRVFHATYGLECVSLRYFNVFGPRQRADSAYSAVIPRFIEALLEGRAPVIHGDGHQSRDFTYVENVVEANLLAATAAGASGRAFNLGGGRQVDLLALLSILSRILKTRAEPIHEEERAGDVRHSLADLSLAQEVLGYEPTIDLEEGLSRTVAWFRRSPGEKS
jgi:UDP-glucose 4-epimerase